VNADRSYLPRVVDDELDRLLSEVPAISLEGPKGVGKTATALRRVATTYALDRPASLQLVQADPSRLTRSEQPVLVDEWQRYPPSWDVVRRAVDDGAAPGRFLLTGSAALYRPGTHSGAGRILGVRMRPRTLSERGVDRPTVSLRSLLDSPRTERGAPAVVEGATNIALVDYVRQLESGGFPGMPEASISTRRSWLQSYVARIVDRDFPEAGLSPRNPALLHRWLSAYAAATSTTASFEAIRDAASAGTGSKPAKTTTIPYQDTLQRIWISDPVPAWAPTHNHLRRLTFTAKHQLADPALALALVDLTGDDLLDGRGLDAPMPRDGTFLGALFESLVALSLRVYAQAAGARVCHLRTKGGAREVDFVVVAPGRRVIAVEVKVSQTVQDADVRHLHWLREQLGPDLVDALVVTTGPEAYRRRDGIAVVPAALLGP
jgi:predicted AAA+ superfamily ATPase